MLEYAGHPANQAGLPIARREYGLFRCAYCANAELVEADDDEHDGLCRTREWADELPSFSGHLRTPLRELPPQLLGEMAWLDDLPDDTIWADVLIAFGVLAVRLVDEDDGQPRCPCCDRRAELIGPLVLAA